MDEWHYTVDVFYETVTGQWSLVMVCSSVFGLVNFELAVEGDTQRGGGGGGVIHTSNDATLTGNRESIRDRKSNRDNASKLEI